MENTTLPNLSLGELNKTPLGDFRLIASNLGLVALEWAKDQPRLFSYLQKIKRSAVPDQKNIATYADQLSEYLSGKRTTFTIPIDWTFLTPFQRKTLQAVFRIPYGEIRTYAEIAKEIDHPLAFRAVGAANGKNPMAIFIPCHRVLGTDGKLHGYGGGNGLPTKKWLLKLEGVNLTF